MAIENREYVCGECLNKFKGRQDEKEMLQKYRENKACFGEKSSPVFNIDREIYFSKCPGNYFSYSVVSYLEMHSQFEKGSMPYPGSMVDQPAKLIEIFKLFSNFKSERQAAAQKKEAMRTQRRGR